MAKAIVFGAHYFKTKTAAIKNIQQRIKCYEQGEKLSPLDELFFKKLFVLHSEYEEKKGAGIDFLTVEKDFHGNKCLYIHRIDGSKIDCSWRHCLTPASQKTIVSMGFRRAIKDIVMAYKSERLKEAVICPILKISLTVENSHTAYLDPSFEKLLSNFLSQKNMQYKDIQLTNPQPDDADQRAILTDGELTVSWRSYHQNNAKLTLLSQEANLRKAKG